jgi:hypothetical protein
MQGTVRLKDKIQDTTIPVTYYGEDDHERILMCIFSDEQELNLLWRLFTPYRYSYKITISK